MPYRHFAGGSINFFLGFGFLVYRWMLMPTLKAFLPLIGALSFDERIKLWIRLRKTHNNYTPMKDRPIWFHAASGEIEHAKSLIRQLRQEYPQKSILLTYNSTSALKLMEGLDVTAILPLPLDEKKNVRIFLSHFKPLICCVARSDLWPEMLHQCKEMEIPVLYFSVMLSPNQNKVWLKFLSRWLSSVSLSYSEDLAEAQKIFKSSEVSCEGDPRNEQIQLRIDNSDMSQYYHPEISVFGSTWPEDDEVLVGGVQVWLSQGRKVIWAPHETDEGHLTQLEDTLTLKQISFVRFSHFKGWEEPQVIIVDRVGVLLELYSVARCAFIGGSFKKKVHSVLEPLLWGLPVAVGPYSKNSKEVVLFEGQGVTVIRNPEELALWLKSDLRKTQPKIQKNASQELLKKIIALSHLKKI